MTKFPENKVAVKKTKSSYAKNWSGSHCLLQCSGHTLRFLLVRSWEPAGGCCLCDVTVFQPVFCYTIEINMSREKFEIWNDFLVNAFDICICSANCNTCGAKLSRGEKDVQSYRTSALLTHLRSKHPGQFIEYERETESNAVYCQLPSYIVFVFRASVVSK